MNDHKRENTLAEQQNQNQIRIRDNPTVKELNIPKDKMELLQKIESSNITDERKQRDLKKLTGSQCCICSIPSHEVIYHIDGATQMERYCQDCIKKVFEREAVL